MLKNDTPAAVIDEGLKHVHNDTCYRCLCTVRPVDIDALKSGKYDVYHVAVMMSQSGRRMQSVQLYSAHT